MHTLIVTKHRCIVLTISDGFVSSKIYDTRDDFDVCTVIFPFVLQGLVSRHVADFNTLNKRLTAKLLIQGISKPEMYGNFVYIFGQIVGRNVFLISLRK